MSRESWLDWTRAQLSLGATQTGQVSTSGSAALFNITTTTNEPALSLAQVSAVPADLSGPQHLQGMAQALVRDNGALLDHT